MIRRSQRSLLQGNNVKIAVVFCSKKCDSYFDRRDIIPLLFSWLNKLIFFTEARSLYSV